MAGKFEIAGLTITQAQRIHDYVQLGFDNGWGLNIYNRIVSPEISESFLRRLADCIVEAEDVRDGRYVLRLDGGMSIAVGIEDDDYNGPEAMELIKPSGVRVVWA